MVFFCFKFVARDQLFVKDEIVIFWCDFLFATFGWMERLVIDCVFEETWETVFSACPVCFAGEKDELGFVSLVAAD